MQICWAVLPTVVFSDASYIGRKVTVLYEPNIIRMSYPGTASLLRRFSDFVALPVPQILAFYIC